MEGGEGQQGVVEWKAQSINCKMNSRLYCRTWGILPVFSNNYKLEANFINCIIRKKRKEKRQEGGKQGRKIMAVTKAILIRLLAKDFRMEQWPSTGWSGGEAHIQCSNTRGHCPQGVLL